MRKIVSIDYDSTLSLKRVQTYAKELIERGIEVWVVTSRFDDLHIGRYNPEATNEDLWGVIDELKIPRWRVRFTNMELKANYLLNTKVIWHLDDDSIELAEIAENKETIGIQVKAEGWKEKCNKLLK